MSEDTCLDCGGWHNGFDILEWDRLTHRFRCSKCYSYNIKEGTKS
jgi:hypothetical protein